MNYNKNDNDLIQIKKDISEINKTLKEQEENLKNVNILFNKLKYQNDTILNQTSKKTLNELIRSSFLTGITKLEGYSLKLFNKTNENITKSELSVINKINELKKDLNLSLTNIHEIINKIYKIINKK